MLFDGIFDSIIEHFTNAGVTPGKTLGPLPIPVCYSDTWRIGVHVNTENQQFNVFRTICQPALETTNRCCPLFFEIELRVTDQESG